MAKKASAKKGHQKNAAMGQAIGLALLSVCCVALLGTLVYTRFSGQEETASLRGEVSSLRTQLEDAATALSTTESAAEAASSELNARVGELTSQVEALTSEKSKLNSQIATLKSQLEASEKALAASREREAALRKQLNSSAYPAGAKLVALTFDDGPGRYTGELLDFIESRGVKATFFVIANNASRYSSLLPRMLQLGCEIGNHSTAHKNLKTLSTQGNAMSKDVLNAQSIITKCSGGVAPTLMRPPGGNYNAAVQLFAKQNDLAIINWSVDTRDWESRNVDSILKVAFNSNSRIKAGSIVLMHDIYSTSVEAAKIMIDRLLDGGFTLVTVSELIEYYDGIKNAGWVYNSATSKKTY